MNASRICRVLLLAVALAIVVASLAPLPGARSQLVADFPRVTYTSSVTTLTGNPVTLDSPSALSSAAVLTTVSLGFSFTFFGRTYTQVVVSLNGNIQFDTSVVASTPLAFPTTAQSVLPVLAFAWTSLTPTTGSTLAYKTIGAAPSRQFVLRFSNVSYAAAAATDPRLSADVILYETTNAIQVSYYALPNTTQAVTVGLSSAFHDDWTTEWVVYSGLNVATLTSALASTLAGRSLTWTPSTSTPYVSQSPTPAVVSSGSYAATITTSSVLSQGALPGAVTLPATNDAITAVNLGFAFFFYGSWYVAINAGANGDVQFATASTSSLTTSMPAGNTALRPFIALAFSNWNSALTVSGGAGSRQYALSGTSGSYQFTLRYNAVAHNDQPSARLSVDLVLFQSDYHFEVRYYRLDPVLTPVVIGIQSAGQLTATLYDYVSVWNNLPVTATASTFLVGKTISYTYANGTVTPVPPIPRSYASTFQVARALRPLVNATYLNGANDNVDTVNIGFAFWFYGAYYSRVQITCNGDLQFRTSIGTYTPLSLPTRAITRNPYLAYFYTDLSPLSNTARSFSLTGTYPNRVFTLRLDSVPYASTQYNSPAPSVTIDVDLFERNGTIAVHYYSVVASSQYVLVGVEGSGVMRIDSSFDYNDIVNNATVGTAVVSSLNGQSLWLTPTGFSGPPPLVPAQTYRAVRTSPPPPRPTLTGSVYLRPSDDILYQFSIGFTFRFFGVNYTTVVFSTNGNLQFGPAYSSSWTPQSMPTGNAAVAPFIAFLYSDMVGFAPDASSEFARLGTAPNRSLLVRLDRYGYRFDSETPALTADIVLFEGSNNIEIRYYLLTGSIPRSTDAPQNVLIGIQGAITPRIDNSYDSTIVWNAEPLTDTAAALYNNSVLTFSLADPNAPVVSAIPDTYTVNVTRGVPALASLSGATTLLLTTNAVQQVPIGFLFSFYGELYNTLYVSTNGNVQFLSSSASSVPLAMPSVGAGTPVIAFFFTALAPAAATASSSSSISYATVGSTYPTRSFVLRFRNVPYATNTSQAAISADLILYELDGQIEIRYYRVDPTPAQNVVVGVQDVAVQREDWSYDFTAFVNLAQLQPTTVSQLAGNTLRFAYATPIAPPPPLSPIPCVAVGTYTCSHTLSIVAPVDMSDAVSTGFSSDDADDEVNGINIGFSFRFFNRMYTAVNVSSNGNVQFITSDYQWDSEALPSGNGPLAPLLAFAFADLYASAGSRTYKTFGTAPNRYFVLRYFGVWFIRSTSTVTVDIVLFETTNVIELRYYQVGTTLLPTLIGLTDVLPPSGNDFDYAVLVNSVGITNTLSQQLSGSTVRFTRVNAPSSPLPVWYSTSTLSDPLPTRVTSPDLRYLPGSNDNLDVVQIGFPFAYYGQYYTSVSISSNGDLQFRTANPIFYNQALPWDDFARTPFFGFFYTDLFPVASTARSFLRTGTAPSRQFLLRYDNVPYTTTRTQASPPSVSIDVVLNEAGYAIDVRYYRIDVSVQLVTIGAQSFSRLRADGTFDYTVPVNTQAVSQSLATQYAGKTLRFTPRLAPSAAPRVPYPSYSMRRNFTVPARVDLPAPGSLPGSGGNTWVYVPIGFTFPFYGSNYTWCNINQNGYIMFASLSLVQMPEPMPYGNYGNLPMIAPFFGDLTSASGYGLWLYQTLGTAPNRWFVVRMDGIQYSANSNIQSISVDTILYETTGRVELRFYSVGRSLDQTPVLIGIQGPPVAAGTLNDGTYDYTVLWNCDYLTDADAIDLQGTSVVFDPVPAGGLAPTAPVPPTYTSSLVVTGQTSPQLPLPSANVLAVSDDSLTAVPIGFVFPFYGHLATSFRINSNGLIQFLTSTSAVTPDAIPYGNSRTMPFIALFFTDLVPLTTSSMVYETIGRAPNRTFVLRVSDVTYKSVSTQAAPPRLALDLLLYETTGVIETRYYRIAATDQVVLIGMQGSRLIRDDSTADFVVLQNAVSLPAATAAQLQGSSLLVQPVRPSDTAALLATVPPLAPRAVQSRGSYVGVHVLDVPARIALPSPTRVSSSTDLDVVRSIPIGFSFVFFGLSYTTVSVSSNGNLQFTSGTTSTTSVPGTMPDANGALRPFLAFFLARMLPSPASRVYQTIGTAPNRRFVLQLVSAALFGAPTSLDVDIVLFESSNRIELRYYAVPPFASSALIGMQSGQDWADYSVALNNVPVSTAISLQLSGSTVVFTPMATLDLSSIGSACTVSKLPTSWSATAYPTQVTLEFAISLQQLAIAWSATFVQNVVDSVSAVLSISSSQIACLTVGETVVQVSTQVGNTTTTSPLTVVQLKLLFNSDASVQATKLASQLSALVQQPSSALYTQLPADFAGLLRSTNYTWQVYCASTFKWSAASDCPELAPTTTNKADASSSSSGLSAGAAAGIAIGCAAAVLIVALVAWRVFTRSRPGKSEYTGWKRTNAPSENEPSQVSTADATEDGDDDGGVELANVSKA